MLTFKRLFSSVLVLSFLLFGGLAFSADSSERGLTPDYEIADTEILKTDNTEGGDLTHPVNAGLNLLPVRNTSDVYFVLFNDRHKDITEDAIDLLMDERLDTVPRA